MSDSSKHISKQDLRAKYGFSKGKFYEELVAMGFYEKYSKFKSKHLLPPYCVAFIDANISVDTSEEE